MKFCSMLAAILLVGVLLIGLVGCGDQASGSGTTTRLTTTTTTGSKPTLENGRMVFPLTLWVTADSMRVRSGPGTRFDAIGGTRKGDTWTATAKEGDWFKITFTDGKEGYVNAQYVSLTDPAKTTTTKQTTTTATAISTISEKQALDAASAYFGIKSGDIDDRTGYRFSYMIEQYDNTDDYLVTLRWLVENHHYSTVDEIIVEGTTGECCAQYA